MRSVPLEIKPIRHGSNGEHPLALFVLGGVPLVRVSRTSSEKFTHVNIKPGQTKSALATSREQTDTQSWGTEI